MPLNTIIYVLDKIDPQEVFQFCNALMDAGDPASTETYDEWESDGIVSLDNAPSQGLPAWLMSSYRKKSPLYSKAQYDEDEAGGDSRLLSPACHMEISFDTAYAYRDTFGGCTELHGRYIVSLHDWLRQRQVRMSWRDPFSGAINDGTAGLENFFNGGDHASSWFNESVIPLVKDVDLDITLFP